MFKGLPVMFWGFTGHVMRVDYGNAADYMY